MTQNVTNNIKDYILQNLKNVRSKKILEMGRGLSFTSRQQKKCRWNIYRFGEKFYESIFNKTWRSKS